jgi:type I restriction enzyme S subunit
MNRTEWNNVKLKDICSSQSSNISQNKIQHLEGNYPIFGASGFIQYVDFFKQDNEYIAIVKDGAGVGRVMRLPANSSILGTLQYIIPNQNTDINYLFYLLNKLDLAKYASGATIPHIYFRDYSNEKVPFPSDIQTQRDIAATLDKANELIALRKKQLQELNTLAESVFYEMFGDPVKNEKGWNIGKLGDTVSSVNYGTSDPAVEDGKYKYLRMNNITYSGYLDLSNMKYINIADKDKEKYIVKKGDLLFNRTNSKDLVGKSAIYTENEEMIIAGYIIRVRCNELFHSRYVWGYLNSKHGKAYLKNLCKNIVGMANINAKELQGIPLLLPPLPLQIRFASIIEKIEAEKSLVLQALQESEGLFQRLMQDLFPKG